jgi:hypothetical protein
MRSSTNTKTLKSGLSDLIGSLDQKHKDIKSVHKITKQLAKVVSDMQDIKGTLKRPN